MLNLIITIYCTIDEKNEMIRVQDVYKVSEDSATILKADYGQWQPKSSMTVFEEDIWKRRSDFQGKTIR